VAPSGLQLVSLEAGQDLRSTPPPRSDAVRRAAIACFSMRLLDIVSIFNKVKREHMTSMTRQYSSATSRARSAVDKTADFWAQGARTLTDRLPGLPQIDLIPAVERYFDLVQQTVDINRRLTIKWAEAAGTLSEMVRDRAESAGNLVREKAESAGDIVRDKAESAERTAREQAEQAEKERAREARFAERQQARQAHDKARERYEGLTKAELSDQLAKRQLPKSGNVDELIERLVEADSK